MGGRAAEDVIGPRPLTSKNAVGKGPKLAAQVWPYLGNASRHFMHPVGKGKLWHEYAKTTQPPPFGRRRIVFALDQGSNFHKDGATRRSQSPQLRHNCHPRDASSMRRAGPKSGPAADRTMVSGNHFAQFRVSTIKTTHFDMGCISAISPVDAADYLSGLLSEAREIAARQ